MDGCACECGSFHVIFTPYYMSDSRATGNGQREFVPLARYAAMPSDDPRMRCE